MSKGKVYGYCRVSTPKQNIERQVRNILASYPDAELVQETYTGTRFQGREKLEKLIKKLKPGDTVVFDEVSRMSRSAEEGFELYQRLYNEGISLVFLKEPYIDTGVYQKALESQIKPTGTSVDSIIDGINTYLMALAREQIQLAFEQAQKEVDDMRQRTREGLQTARLNGKQIGRKAGTKFHTKKGDKVKRAIATHSKAYGGNLSNNEIIRMLNVSRDTFYRYKREMDLESQGFQLEIDSTK